MKSDKAEDKSILTPQRAKGEVYVWFSGMGLTIGLLMVCFLFGLIGYQGIIVFWPREVVEVVFDEPGAGGIGSSTVIAGVPDRVRQRTERIVQDGVIPESFSEERFFVGNRDAYGQSFTHFRTSQVTERRLPKDLIIAERREWGDAIFYPVRLKLEDGASIEQGHARFDDTLATLVREAQDRRATIGRIDRREIGKINYEMREIELTLRYYQQKGYLSASEQAQVQQLNSKRAELQESYQILEARANQLREQQTVNLLEYRLPGGEQGSIQIGNLYDFYYPNRLSLFGRIKIFFQHIADFVTGYPREANTEGGIYPAIFGTFVMTLIMSIAVMPFGVIAAVYLREYAKQGPLVRAVRISVNNLAGVPSIVFGVFGLGFFVYLVGGSIDQLFYSKALPTPTFGSGGILWAGLTLALLNVPVVIVATKEALTAVSRGVREGALACGASKWQTIQNLVLPASLPGILTGLVLAMARGAGEVAPLMLVGVVALAPNLPIDGNFPFIHLERSFMHLGFHIYDVGFQSPDSEAAIPMVFATTLVLISLIVVLNLSAILLRNHIRKKNQAAAF